MEREINLYRNFLREKIIDTVFIGGGTPSSVDEKFIERILKILSDFEFSEDSEISIESNPNSLTREKAETYFSSGINRISIGAQSFNDEILKKIGRIHKSEDIFRAVDNARSAGFTNINLDLEAIKDIYNEAKFFFEDRITKRLDEAQNFHNQLVENRKNRFS